MRKGQTSKNEETLFLLKTTHSALYEFGQKKGATSKEKGLLPKEIAAGSRKRYYKGRTEEDVAEILDYYFSHANKSKRHP